MTKFGSGTLTTNFVRDNWRDVVDNVMAGEHFVVTRSGKPMVAIIPIEDYEAIRGTLRAVKDVIHADEQPILQRGA